MISTPDLYKEINKYDKLTKDGVNEISDIEFKQAVIKLAILQNKLSHNLRTNMVQVMKHFHIETVKPKSKHEEAEPKEEGK